MSASLKTVSSGITKMLKGMSQREAALQGFFRRNIFEQYVNIQRKRWMTENDYQWDALDPIYAKRKLTQFRSYPGRGSKMMIATERLFKSVTGKSPEFRMVTTNKSFYVATTVPYARYANEARNFNTYRKETIRELNKSISDFVFKAIKRQAAEIS